MPPVPDAVALPLAPPLHRLLVGVVLAVRAVGWVMVTGAVDVQPLLSRMVTVYVEALRPLAVWVLWPLLQLYV